jgi:hypothetical protein
METPEDYLKKILKIAEVKYELDEDVIRFHQEFIDIYYESNVSPRRAVELIVGKIF